MSAFLSGVRAEGNSCRDEKRSFVTTTSSFSVKDIKERVVLELGTRPFQQRERSKASGIIATLSQEALTGRSAERRLAAARELEPISVKLFFKDLKVLLDALNDPQPEVRWRVAAKLGHAKQNLSADNVQQLAKYIDDEHWEVRTQVVKAIGMSGRDKASNNAGVLVKALKDRHWQVRQAAAQALQDVDPYAIVPLAAQVAFAAYHDPDTQLRAILTDILLHIHNKEGLRPDPGMDQVDKVVDDSIVQMLSSDDSDARILACHCMRLLKPQGVNYQEQLAGLLRDNRMDVRVEAAKALGHMGGSLAASADAINEMLSDPSPSMRQTAVRVIAQLGNQGAMYAPKMAVMCTCDPDEKVRAVCVQTLSSLGRAGEVYVVALAMAATDESKEVKTAAARALKVVGDVGASNIAARILELPSKSRLRFQHVLALTTVQAQRPEVLCACLCEWACNPEMPVPIEGVTRLLPKPEQSAAKFPFQVLRGRQSTTYVVFETDSSPWGWMDLFTEGLRAREVDGHMIQLPSGLWAKLLPSLEIAVDILSHHRDTKLLYVTGHGKGGIAASILALCLRDKRLGANDKIIKKIEFSELRVAIYGSPNVVTTSGNPEIENWIITVKHNLQNSENITFCRSYLFREDPIPVVLSDRLWQLAEFFGRSMGWFVSSSVVSLCDRFLGKERDLAEHFCSILPQTYLDPRMAVSNEYSLPKDLRPGPWFDERLHGVQHYFATILRQATTLRTMNLGLLFDSLAGNIKSQTLPSVFAAWREYTKEQKQKSGEPFNEANTDDDDDDARSKSEDDDRAVRD